MNKPLKFVNSQEKKKKSIHFAITVKSLLWAKFKGYFTSLPPQAEILSQVM